MQTPISYFTSLTDPRVDRSKEHLMEDIIFITIASVICGAETWNDIENYGKSKESWLKQYLQLPNGIPSHDSLVTIDVMGCQRDIATKIVEKGGDYLLAVKGNQGCLEEDVARTVRFAKPASEWVEEDFGHGRIEQRKCTLYDDLSFIDNAMSWKNLSAVVKIEATRYIKSSGKEEKEVRFYITSSKKNAEVIGRGVRSHWGIENNLHWQLDVSFNEDDSRKREGHAAQNFSLLNRIALNLIKHEQSKKRSVKGKRLDAGWNNDYLLKILRN